MRSSVQNPRATSSLIFARIVYAINWVNVGAIWYLMGPGLGEGVSGLGTVAATFYVGIGIMQLPGGLVAAKFGPKRVVVAGIFLTSLSVLATSAATSVAEVAALRFLVGWGMAFVFAPMVVMIAGLLRGGKSGMGVGMLNSAFEVGGLFGLFVWVVIASTTGWRPSLELSGFLGLLTGVLVALFVPDGRSAADFRVERAPLMSVVADRQLVLLGLGTLGIGIANNIISGFIIYYQEDALGIQATTAALVGALVFAVPIFVSLWGGRLFDVASKHRALMLASLLGGAAALAIGAYPSVYAAAACSVIGGIVTGVGYTFAFAGARDLNRAGKEYDSLAIAWVNSISLTGSFFPPLLFSYAVHGYGYQSAWIASSLIMLVFLVPIFLMVEEWRR